MTGACFSVPLSLAPSNAVIFLYVIDARFTRKNLKNARFSIVHGPAKRVWLARKARPVMNIYLYHGARASFRANRCDEIVGQVLRIAARAERPTSTAAAEENV